MNITDLHSHVLPNLDDGARSIDMAVEMCKKYADEGVDTVICTPHYYHSREKSVERFIEKRNKRLCELKEELSKRNIKAPKFVLGAEVLFDFELTEIPDIEKLAIENTEYILIEMPYSPWQDWLFNYLFDFTAITNLKPVIAHVERYDQPIKQIYRLYDMDVYFQLNGASVFKPEYKKRAIQLLKEAKFHFIGTDTHNLEKRPPVITPALDFISKKISKEYADILVENGNKLQKNEEVEKYIEVETVKKRFLWF